MCFLRVFFVEISIIFIDNGYGDIDFISFLVILVCVYVFCNVDDIFWLKFGNDII